MWVPGLPRDRAPHEYHRFYSAAPAGSDCGARRLGGDIATCGRPTRCPWWL
jgi:hypothetical protein